MKRWLAVVIGLVSWTATAGEVSWAPGVSFSGAPSYVSEFPTRFRDNGGPLSPAGSHVGLKAEVRSRRFAGVQHFACATGRYVYDYSRTGLALTSGINFSVGGSARTEALTRRVRFEYFGWEEDADFGDFSARARVVFLGLDRYLLAITVRGGATSLELTPELTFNRNGRQLILEKSSRPDELLFRFTVQPTTMPGKNYLAVLSSSGAELASGKDRKSFVLRGQRIALAPGEDKSFFFIFGFALDESAPALAAAREAKAAFTSPEGAWQAMLAEREKFFASLPVPHLAAGDAANLELYRMAATALDNALYAPRGAMKYWACVPTKVHYNWFWLWDSGFEALGYSEFSPKMGIDNVMAIFQAQRKDGFIAHMTDENAKPLTPHSQSPVFGWVGQKMIERRAGDPAYREFERELYERNALYLEWWDKARDVNHNGLYEYMSQDEGGWDNSPRMYYVNNGPFISYYGSLGELIGMKVKPLDNVDANAWMYSNFRAMERWANDLGKPEAAKIWRERALTLAAKIDEVLWDPQRNCWLDTYNWKGSKKMTHFDVLTPHIWFPAFTGATRDESKARAAIEQHLLNPAEFFGKYPIPIVAYNDKTYDNTKPGWTASIWLVTAYSALEALWRFGYEAEALDLRARLLAMMAEQGGMKGIYETYDPETGSYKNAYSTGGYASTQFGWSSTFTMEMVLDRYQDERFAFADTARVGGFIRRVEDFDSRDDLYFIEAGLDVPRVELTSADGQPLTRAGAIKIKLSDPYRTQAGKTFTVHLRGQAFPIELDREQIVSLK
jgi:hypothetical protein